MFATRADRYGYGLLVSPMFEHLEVFLRAHGVVKHEYYTHNPHGGVRGVYVGCRTIDKPFGSLLVPKVRGIY